MTQAAASTSALRPGTTPKALDAASHTAQRLVRYLCASRDISDRDSLSV